MKKVFLSLAFAAFAALSASAAPITINGGGLGVVSTTTNTFTLSSPLNNVTCTLNPGAQACTNTAGLTAGTTVNGTSTTFDWTIGGATIHFAPTSGAITAGQITARDVILYGTFTQTTGGTSLLTSATPGTLEITWQNGASLPDPVQFSYTASTVPEPGSMALLGSGLVGLGFIARRRRASK